VRNITLAKITHKKITALLAAFILLFSLKGVVLCFEGGQDYVLEFKYSPCCYKIPINKTSKPLLKSGNLKYKSGFCVDYDISVFSHIVQNKIKFSKYFPVFSNIAIVTANIFFHHNNILTFFEQFNFVRQLCKIISSTVLII
jgi:hypothetical protein